MLTATMGVNNDEKSVGFHYDLNSRIGLSSWYNSNHDSYIGTDWSFKFYMTAPLHRNQLGY